MFDDSVDFAGTTAHPNYFQSRTRINRLIDRYLSIDCLSDCLADLPNQFNQPHQRKWERIHWQAIDRSQIIGIDPDIFLSVIASAVEIEAPIRAYAKESWDYLQAVHPQMAFFMGGDFAKDGSSCAIGIWEKEERQHAPTFGKIYQQLTGQKLQPKPNTVQGCHAIQDPWHDLNHHVLSRIATEWSATSVYLWLMAHSTGELQRAIAQPLMDEVNHLAKFWGFSRWTFETSYRQQLQGSVQHLIALLQHHQDERTHADSLLQLNRDTLIYSLELTFTFSRVMVRLHRWNQELSYSYLRHLLGTEVVGLDGRIAA